jgi:hypothetical protein
MKSVRSLKRKAYAKVPPYENISINMYGKDWDIWPVTRRQVRLRLRFFYATTITTNQNITSWKIFKYTQIL